MDQTNIIPISIEDEMRDSYMDYAMSVIVGRALPDIRDGLKPVHRRILYAMYGEGLLSNKRFSKCAGVVGEVLKRLHPHGDSAVYDALVRMAQGWSLRYPLIDGQGNFGSIDGDSPAAYRYTECRMHSLAEAILADIDKETVDFMPNFDDSSEEPMVLPSRVPNLLINGAEGIAVGMATKIPPHNLGEICSGILKLIEDPSVGLAELMEVIPGPDFPTAGIIYGSAPIRQMYATGRGLVKIRGKYHIETLKGAKKDVEAIIIDEIPYQVNKAKLVERIAELVNEKLIEGIARLRDESDRRGMRIVMELKRDAVAEVIVNQLFSLTAMQRTFGVTMLAIVNGRPEVLSLKRMLELFIEHRRTVVTRRSRFELRKAEARLHILAGLKVALDNIDQVIKLIKASESTQAAKEQLQEHFSLSDIQAQHILDMPLRRLTALEQKAIEDEHKELEDKIAELKKLLSSQSEMDKVIAEETREVSEKFSDKRRTQIEDNGEEIELEDMIAEEDMIVSISHKGYAKRCSPAVYKSQARGGKGVQGTKKSNETEVDSDFVSELFITSTHSYLLVFTTSGKLFWLKAYKLPEAGRTARGRALVNILNMKEDEKISTVLPVREFTEGQSVVMVSKKGYIKRVDLKEFSRPRNGGIIATKLDQDDELIGVKLTDSKTHCIVSSRSGMSIRFDENDVREMGRAARGVRAIRLGKSDSAVNLVCVPADDKESSEYTLLTICENGYGKRTELAEYRCQSRGGKGTIDIKTSARNGELVGVRRVKENDDLMLITTSGNIIRIPASSVSCVGRNTQGVRLVRLAEGEKVAAVARVQEGVAEKGEESEEG